MAKREKTATPEETIRPTSKADVDDMMKDLITSINKEFGTRVAYNLSEMEAPTIVKRWIDTGSIQLNYAIKNAAGGGYPEGRIIEISGPPSIGKSHLAYHAAAIAQKMGGLVVYVDTENATPVQKLAEMGIDVRKRFVYCDSHCTEEVFSIIESTITKAKQIIEKNVPIVVIWDSVAATSPKAELEGEYEDNTIGLQARVISKGMRKITGVIGQNNVTLLCLNQIREKIGCVGPSTQLTVRKRVA
jgi:recombination protein RecA